MRVIAGSARGRNLKGPPRPRDSGRPGIRPTSDLIRGVIFDMLDAMGASYDRVLDLFAGTGALGIEALSRGDGTADFVERDPEGARIIDANLMHLGFTARAKVHRLDVRSAVARLRGPYTLVLADPPYYDSDALAVVTAYAQPDFLAPGGVLVVEHHRRAEAPDALGVMRLYRRRRHGDTVVSIYEEEDAS
jgi:16S rRNA (guanine(966)-N(2))-methyltransferase RsmD